MKKKPASRDTKNPAANQAVTQGETNLQGGQHARRLRDGDQTDRSEGSNMDGQPTARHGQGAGFSRDIH